MLSCFCNADEVDDFTGSFMHGIGLGGWTNFVGNTRTDDTFTFAMIYSTRIRLVERRDFSLSARPPPNAGNMGVRFVLRRKQNRNIKATVMCK